MRRPKLAKALTAAAAILILAAGCTQNPVSPEANSDEQSRVYATAGS